MDFYGRYGFTALQADEGTLRESPKPMFLPISGII
jgi:hypothetical protein